MTDPIDLDAYRPHEVSKMLCTRCGHKWTAVHPVGVTGLECPNCHEMEGQQMSDIVKGMADVLMQSLTADGGEGANPKEAMRAALLFLADNVSKEMSVAAVVQWQDGNNGGCLQEWLQDAIAAALRAAAGGGE